MNNDGSERAPPSLEEVYRNVLGSLHEGPSPLRAMLEAGLDLIETANTSHNAQEKERLHRAAREYAVSFIRVVLTYTKAERNNLVQSDELARIDELLAIMKGLLAADEIRPEVEQADRQRVFYAIVTVQIDPNGQQPPPLKHVLEDAKRACLDESDSDWREKALKVLDTALMLQEAASLQTRGNIADNILRWADLAVVVLGYVLTPDEIKIGQWAGSIRAERANLRRAVLGQSHVDLCHLMRQLKHVDEYAYEDAVRKMKASANGIWENAALGKGPKVPGQAQIHAPIGDAMVEVEVQIEVYQGAAKIVAERLSAALRLAPKEVKKNVVKALAAMPLQQMTLDHVRSFFSEINCSPRSAMTKRELPGQPDKELEQVDEHLREALRRPSADVPPLENYYSPSRKG